MPLLTVRQAASRVGVSYPTFKHWIYQGTVRTTRTAGGHHRVADTEVDRLLAQSAGPMKEAPAGHQTSGTIVSISGRNQLRGFVEEVRTEGLLAQVRLRIGDQRLTAVITRDAVDELRLRRGDAATAIIKATEVMIAREASLVRPAAPRSKRRPGVPARVLMTGGPL